ncbi:MAG: CHRD domain-containing protein [Planctomycetaceae bacterium]|nr:CHRD domain-containing protein [Planctomycetaceae bacterium]
MTRLVCLATLAAAVLAMPSESDGAVIVYTANLSGPNEAPPNASPGTGFVEIDVDDVANTMHVHATFSGLLGTTTAAHIHSPTTTPGMGTAGVATTVPTFVGFPLGVTSGVYDNTLDLLSASSYNPAFVAANGGTAAAAEAALLAGLADDRAYFNIHTSVFGGGEVRGFLTPAVPEPGTVVVWSLLAAVAVSGVYVRVKR